MQEQARRQNLAPLEYGPLGKVANATSTRQAHAEILHAQPLVGGEQELIAQSPASRGAIRPSRPAWSGKR